MSTDELIIEMFAQQREDSKERHEAVMKRLDVVDAKVSALEGHPVFSLKGWVARLIDMARRDQKQEEAVTAQAGYKSQAEEYHWAWLRIIGPRNFVAGVVGSVLTYVGVAASKHFGIS